MAISGSHTPCIPVLGLRAMAPWCMQAGTIDGPVTDTSGTFMDSSGTIRGPGTHHSGNTKNDGDPIGVPGWLPWAAASVLAACSEMIRMTP